MSKLKIGIIGAGAISDCHIEAYMNNPDAELVAICDVNEATAKAKASQYNIPAYYTDADKILSDESIDAVSIVTPTFTHKNLIIEALNKGKHILSEKPPAKNFEEAEEIRIAAEKSGKVVMFGFVCRFFEEIKYLKEFVDSGAMGDIYYAEASRIDRACQIKGWFTDKEKSGGGALLDAAIHELDIALYLMGYPEIASVKGFATDINTNLPYSLKGVGESWNSADVNSYERNVESLASGYVHFKNGACLYVKASWVLNSLREGKLVELHGTNAGIEFSAAGTKTLTLENGYFVENTPVLRTKSNPFDEEIKHFTDCIINGTECTSNAVQGAQIMKIISAIYESAKTGKEIVF